jgi:hypothetical protein
MNHKSLRNKDMQHILNKQVFHAIFQNHLLDWLNVAGYLTRLVMRHFTLSPTCVKKGLSEKA